MNQPASTSTRPYLIRALHEWCSDNGFTPHIAVAVDGSVAVPREFVSNDEIVLNISMDAASGLQLGNDSITFKARFGGVPRDIYVPVGRVLAIYARENGQGMAFPAEDTPEVAGDDASESDTKPAMHLVSADAATAEGNPVAASRDEPEPPTPPAPPAGGRPALKRVK